MWPNIEYKLVLLKPGNPYTQVKQLGIDIAENEKTWRKKTYYYNAEDISYRKGRKYFIFKDVDSGGTILRWGKRDEVAPEEPGARTFTGLVRMALTSLGGEYGLIVLILAGVAGLVGGLLIGISPLGSYFHGNQTVATTAKTVVMLLG